MIKVEEKIESMKDKGYLPDFSTFPISDISHTDSITGVNAPSEEDVTQTKEWGDFKEM